MNPTAKTLYFFCIGWIIFSIFLLTAGQLLPFEFTREGTAETIRFVILVSLPVFIPLTLIKQKQKKQLTVKVLTVAATVVAALILLLYMLVSGMCKYSGDTVLFVNKADSTCKIVVRSYGCGAWDSGYPKNEFYVTKPVTQLVRYVKDVDTTQINRNDWLRK